MARGRARAADACTLAGDQGRAPHRLHHPSGPVVKQGRAPGGVVRGGRARAADACTLASDQGRAPSQTPPPIRARMAGKAGHLVES
ncbi:MAG: hypothetical protein JW987_13915 [Anaerolineaceae bacterium]|nr:hypothetical protein [Anaerolineaceae bacterium]